MRKNHAFKAISLEHWATKLIIQKDFLWKSIIKLNRFLRSINFYWFLSDIDFFKWNHRIELGKELDLDNPKWFSEKLIYLILNNKEDEYALSVDKAEFKGQLLNIFKGRYLAQSYGVFETFNDINIQSLPKQFVLKMTHGSGANLFIKNKHELNKYKWKIRLWQRRNWFWVGREYPYKNLKPRILIEEDLSLKGKMIELLFYMFHGELEYIFIIENRNAKAHRECVVDAQWNALDVMSKFSDNFTQGCFVIKPNEFDELLSIAQHLSSNSPFVRVDFMMVDNQIYISELTYFPHAGFRIITNHKGENIEEFFGRSLQI